MAFLLRWRQGRSQHLWGGMRVGAFILLAGSTIQAQQPIRVTTNPCADCTIERRKVLQLAGRDEPIIGPYMIIARDSRGRWLLGTMDRSPGVVAVYDATGALVQRFGRKGEGPGEHIGVFAMVVTVGDTVHLFDNSLRRHSVFSPAYQFVRSNAYAGQVFQAVALSDGSLVVNADFPRPNTVGFPLHHVDGNLKVLRSFGAEVPQYRSDNLYVLTRAIAAAADRGLWVVPRLRYEPALWSLDGKLREFERSAPWFPTQVTVQSPGGARAPSAWVSGVWHDGGEHLWVLVHVPDAQWKPPPNVTAPAGERGPPIIWDREYDTVIEVINTRTGELLASKRFDHLLQNLLPGGYVAHYGEDQDGEPFLEIWQLRFLTTTGGSP